MLELLEESPIIAAIKSWEGLEKSLKSECKVVFVLFGTICDIDQIVARIKDAVMAELRQTFRPEFLNRIDEIIVFHQLTEENIRSIARRMLDTIGSRMAAQGTTLQADDDAVAALAKDGFDARYGARPLRRTLQNEVEDVVAEQMLDGQLKSGDTAHVRLKDDKVVIEK